MSNITSMAKRLFVLLIVFFGVVDKIVAQGPPCPICPPETPQLSIDGFPLYISVALGITMSFILFKNKLMKNVRKA